MTMVMPRTNISKEITAAVKVPMGKKGLRYLIPRYPIPSVRWKQPQRARVFLPMTKSGKVAAAYEQFAKEVAEIGEKQTQKSS